MSRLTLLALLPLFACAHKGAADPNATDATEKAEEKWDPLADVVPFECGPERTPGKVVAFNPNQELELDKYGNGPRPEQDEMLQVIACRYDAMDSCVATVKQELKAEAEAEAAKAKAEGTAPEPAPEPQAEVQPEEPGGMIPAAGPAQPEEMSMGYARLQVLLDPTGQDPMGINVHLPEHLSQRDAFVQCIRTAAAAAPYPEYDGPPVIVDFEIELDNPERAEDGTMMANGPAGNPTPITTDNIDDVFE